MKLSLLFLSTFSFISSAIIAQSSLPNIDNYQYAITPASCQIVVDGVEDECWSSASILTDFWIQSPTDGQRATPKTVVKLLYDDNYLYLFAKCYDNDGYVIQTLKRDNFGDSDEFAIMIDGTGQHTSVYGFGVNADGAQTDAVLYDLDSDQNWDNKWYSSTKRSTDFWTAEMAIPFKTLRFNDRSKEWFFNLLRINPGTNENYVWAPVPRQFEPHHAAYHGKLIWQQAPKKQGGNISLVPYVTASTSKNDSDTDKINTVDAGLDAKVALSSALNLDLTYNPDFSQVEVDQQVTNLTRFNIFFPERRQFFLENNDVFANFGINEEQLFYTRRIGLDQNGSAIPIQYGARLTGNIGEKTKIGLFNINTSSDSLRNGNNYSAIVVQQRLMSRSTIRGIFLNRQSHGKLQEPELDKFGRNAGLDWNLTNAKGTLAFYGGYLHSFKPGITQKANQTYSGIEYNGENFRGFVEVQHVAKDFYNDMGFNSRIENYNPDNNSVTRIGYTNLGSMFNYYYYPKNKKINTHISGVENFIWVNDGTGMLNEWYTRIRHFMFFKNTSELRFRFNHHFVDLLNPFPLGPVVINRDQYFMKEFNIQYSSDNRKKFIAELFVVGGEFYGGQKLTLRAGLTARAQPWGNFTLGIDHNAIKIQNENFDIDLLNLRTEINFSTAIFWTTFIQYNTQSDRFSINSRLQYRYRPMCDLFLVYLDNYDAYGLGKFQPKDRSLVLKANYWLSI